jgi:protein required for attachment to host cells
MATTWILSGDSSRARILQVLGRDRLGEVQEFVNPAGRMDERELTTDAHPRFRGSAGPASDREEPGAAWHETEKFAKELDRFLDRARQERRYDRLFMLAPPKFLGLLRSNLGKEVEKLVGDDMDKDLSWFDAREIERFLKKPTGA